MISEQKFIRRGRVVVIIVTLSFAAILAKSVHLAFFIPEGKVYKHKKQVLRGVIYDRRGLELAISRESYDIGVRPSRVKNQVKVAKLVGPILGLPTATILKKFKKKKNRFFFLKREVDRHKAGLVRGLGLDGVETVRRLSRVYPNKELGAPLLGFTNIDNHGIEGLEKQFEGILSRPADDSGVRGFNLHLTIDGLVQFRTEQVLRKYMNTSGAKRAVAIFMDVATGRVLAMAAVPSYDPNNFGKFPAGRRTNYAVRHNYEPGSTLKVFVAAALLSEGLVDPSEKFYCPGYIELADETIIKCTHAHGHVDMGTVIEKSCNAGIIAASQKISRDKLYYYLRRFGFGERTGISVIGETAGRLPDVDKWDGASRYFIPIGQSIQVTPLQLVTALAAVGNGGTLPQPAIRSHFSDSFGENSEPHEPRFRRQVIPAAVAQTLVRYMFRVVESGTGKLAQLKDIHVAGKTGTGQISGRTGYIEGAYTASFMGLFPADRPKLAGVVLFDRPQDPYSGGGLAAPAFGEIVDTVLPYIDEKRVSEFKSIKPVVLDVSTLPRDRIPNFMGKSVREALLMLGHIDAGYEINGFGYVTAQKPPPGTALHQTEKVILTLNSKSVP